MGIIMSEDAQTRTGPVDGGQSRASLLDSSARFGPEHYSGFRVSGPHPSRFSPRKCLKPSAVVKMKILVALSIIAVLAIAGVAGLIYSSENPRWRPGLQVDSTLATLLVCSAYFLVPENRRLQWYRILMAWAAVLMFSYVLSTVIPGTKPYEMGTMDVAEILPWFLVPVALLAFPIWLIFTLFYLTFASEAIRPTAGLDLNREKIFYPLAIIGILFGFLNGLQVLPGEWGPLGLNETAILGMVYGFLLLLYPPRRLNILVAIIMGFFLLLYVGQPPGMDTGFRYAFQFLWGGSFNLGALTDVMIALAFFPASIISLRRQRAGKLKR